MASTCFSVRRIPISTRPTTISPASPRMSRRRDCASARWSLPVWPPTGGGSAMGDQTERAGFLTQVKKACRIGRKLRDLKIRQYGIVRIDSAASPGDWAKDPEANTKRIAETFREACDIAEDHGERLAAEGEICWAGMHSWRRNVRVAGAGEPSQDARIPGRHGPHHALHDGLQRPRRPPAAG